MGWELFTQKKSSFGKPKITILKSGGILINKNCFEDYIKNKKFINLYYDSDKRKIGIKPVNDEDTYSYKISDNSGSKSLTLSAISFFGKYKIDYKSITRRTYEAVWDDTQSMVVVTLE